MEPYGPADLESLEQRLGGAPNVEIAAIGKTVEGLLERFGIHACLLELNANWIAGLNAPPSADRWKLFGARLCEALFHYFDTAE